MVSFKFPDDVSGWLSLGEGKLLYELAQKNPKLGTIVELGAYHGRSTICLAQGSKKAAGGKVFTVDKFIGDDFIGPQPDFYFKFRDNVKRYQLMQHVTVLRGDTVVVAKKWQGSIRLLFIDASHRYQDVLVEFKAWDKFIVPDGFIAFHDSLDQPGVNKFICQLILSGKYSNFRTYNRSNTTSLTYAVKNPQNEKTLLFYRILQLVEFQLLSLPKLPGRIVQAVKNRGEQDFWYQVLGKMADWEKKIRRG